MRLWRRTARSATESRGSESTSSGLPGEVLQQRADLKSQGCDSPTGSRTAESGLGTDKTTGWPSSAPVIVGPPVPVFEPRVTSSEYRSVPYRPDSVIDGWATDGFVMRAASLRGYRHRYYGVPRQDDLAIAYLRAPERLVVAVADGVSAARQSHFGATIAARYAAQWVAEAIGAEATKLDWDALLRGAAWQLVELGISQFGVERGPGAAAATENLLATTLICAVIDFSADASNAVVHLIGVGDSSAWLLDPQTGGYTLLLGGKGDPHEPITSSAVSGLPRVPADTTPTVVEVPRGSVLLIATDGFGDPLGSGNGTIGQLFAAKLAAPPSMIEFAHLLDFSRETFDDDRTLVAIWPLARHGIAGPGGPATVGLAFGGRAREL